MYYNLDHKRGTFLGGLVQYQPLQKQRRNMNLKNGFVIAQYPNSQGVANR